MRSPLGSVNRFSDEGSPAPSIRVEGSSLSVDAQVGSRRSRSGAPKSCRNGRRTHLIFGEHPNVRLVLGSAAELDRKANSATTRTKGIELWCEHLGLLARDVTHARVVDDHLDRVRVVLIAGLSDEPRMPSVASPQQPGELRHEVRLAADCQAVVEREGA
jgi:hypothetical protein